MAAKSNSLAVKTKIRIALKKNLARLKNEASQDKTVEQL